VPVEIAADALAVVAALAAPAFGRGHLAKAQHGGTGWKPRRPDPGRGGRRGGGALERVLALIDNCEWRRLRRQESGEPVDILPDPDELRSRIGIVPAHPAARSRRAPP
jgi:hypothetical protein